MDQPTTSVFQHGLFLGACALRREAPGFDFAELVPTVPANQVARHTHPNAHLVLLVQGVYISSAAAAPPLAKAPLLIYNPQGTTHRDRFHTIDGRFFTISISTGSLNHISEFIPTLERPTAFGQGHGLALARRLLFECRHWTAPSPLIAEGICLELMAEMTRAPERKHRKPPSWLTAARDLLHDRCSESIGIAEVARASGVHPIHLARTFREFYNCTPGEYLRTCRLEKGARLLTGNSLPISLVAAETGFADQSHFSKSFRKAYQMSPRQFRRAHVS